MHWIIQNGLFNEQGFHDLTDVLDRLTIPYTLVKVIPFSHDLEPKPEVENPIVVMGSTTLVKIAKKYGWGPGVWFNDNFTFEKWREYWGDHLLNADAEVCRFADIKLIQTSFIRPVDDLKAFSGMVVHPDNFHEWQKKVTLYDDGTITSDTLVVVSYPKQIFAEYRFFVIDGRIITGSLYKLGNRVISNENVDPRVEQFARDRVNEWQPDFGFVIDIADTDDGLKIVEINNLNSAGFYKANIGKLVAAIEGIE
jgi:hypothetical protein